MERGCTVERVTRVVKRCVLHYCCVCEKLVIVSTVESDAFHQAFILYYNNNAIFEGGMVYYGPGHCFVACHSYCWTEPKARVYNNYGRLQKSDQGHNRPCSPKNIALLLLFSVKLIVCIDY